MKVFCNRCSKQILVCSSPDTGNIVKFLCTCGNVVKHSHTYIKQQDDLELLSAIKTLIQKEKIDKITISGSAEIYQGIHKVKINW